MMLGLNSREGVINPHVQNTKLQYISFVVIYV